MEIRKNKTTPFEGGVFSDLNGNFLLNYIN